MDYTCASDSEFAFADFVKHFQIEHSEKLPERAIDTRTRDKETMTYSIPQIYSTHLSQENIDSINGPMNNRMIIEDSNNAIQHNHHITTWDLGSDSAYHGFPN